MFQGTLTNQVIKVIGNIVKEWNVKRIYVGCSGNYTIERSISRIINCPITSNDVNIYSSYIGKWFAGENISELHIKEGLEEKYNIFSKYMKTDVDKIATLMIASDMLSNDKDGAYFERMYDAYVEQFPRMHEEMVNKISKIKTNVDTFYHGDVIDMLDTINEYDDGFICFPPFYVGGYEKQFRNLEEVFFYEKPKYSEFSPDTSLEEFCNKVKTIENFIIITERKVDGLEEFIAGKSETTKGKSIYIYKKSKNKYYIAEKMEIKAKPVVKINKNYKLKGDIKIIFLKKGQFAENRLIYLSKRINSGDGSAITLGLYDGDYCFGFVGLCNGERQQISRDIERPHVTIMCDFAVPSVESKLSKLVLYCILSKEMQLICDRFIKKRVKTVSTTAISINPVSMKYRGLFDLVNTKVVKNKGSSDKKYVLTYTAKPGQWTLKEGYEIWRQKYSK